MIRSVHIIGSKHSGGAERFYTRLLQSLHSGGHPVLAVNPRASLVAAALNNELPQRHLPMRGIWDVSSRWRIAHTARDYDADIVQTYMGRATRLTHLPRGRRPVHVARLGGYYNLKGYRHAHAWIANTCGICDYLVGNGLPAERVFHIGNFAEPVAPVNDDALAAAYRGLAIPSSARILLCVARLHPNKGHSDLLSAFARLPTTIADRPVYLVIVGDGPLRDALRALAHRLAIEPRVRWTGWQNTPAVYYDLADLVVLPSRHEPLGNVILEAWAHRKPVLATSTSGPLELITNGEDGVLVPVQDPATMAHTITEILTEGDNLLEALAGGGTDTLRREHSIEGVVEAYLRVYTQLLTGLRG